MKPSEAKYIWYDKTGSGHNLFGLFRQTFEIEGSVESAVLNMFADTNYQLFVNGNFIEFGPVRFDPRFPLYDVHDISSHLKQGKNVIAVLVNHIGHNTFKAIPNKAGLVTWGEVKIDKGKVIKLHSSEGSWKCTCSKSYSIPSQKLSFALNDAEIFSQREDECSWKEENFDDCYWIDAVEIENQDAWGTLEQRNIPFMSGRNIEISGRAKVFSLKKLEEHYSFAVPTPFMEQEENKKKYSNFIAFSSWIFSPEDQKITVGVWGGKTWLNGDPILESVDSHKKNMRINQKWNLKEGWNYYFGYIEAFHGVTEHHISISSNCGLKLSADMKDESLYEFRYSPVLPVESYNLYLKDKPLPYSPKETISQSGGWVYTTKADRAQNPCIDSGWDDYGDLAEETKAEELGGHVFKKTDYPEGFSILLDLDHMNLVFPKICMSGVKDAVIDLTYSEHMNTDNEHISVEERAPLGDRVICSMDDVEWLPVHPRGGRYIQITVRNISKDITVNSLTLRSANYPVQPKGRFNCSDPCLNEVWLMGQRTEQSNMEDAYVDCSGRERGMYGRDTIIQYHVNLATFGDQALYKRCMELFSQSPDATGKFRAVYPNTGDYTISDFALNMLEGYLDYYNNTGDTQLINRSWAVMMENLKWFHELADEREDLLLDAEWDVKRGIHSIYGGFHGDNAIKEDYLDNTGIHCTFSCTYFIALKSALELAKVIGKEKDAAELQRRIDILSKSISEKFWDEEKGCFSDNFELRTHSVHASIFAIRAGVVKEERLEQVKNHITNQLKSLFVNGYDPSDGVFVSPAFAYYIFDGLYKAGLYETAENMIKQGWGWMLSKGLKTCSEFFMFNCGLVRYSLCHAWSASPTYYLSKNVLGVHFPKAPDLNEVEIRVKTHGITYAEGAFPHPEGVIEVKWHMEEGKRVFDYVMVPEGVKVTIIE